MVSMAAGLGAGAAVGAAVGVGVGVAAVMTGGVPAMIRCLDPTALGLVYFDFNPDQIKMNRTANMRQTGNSKGGASASTPAIVKPATINLSKIIFVGDDTKMRVDQLFQWCAPPEGLFTALASLAGITSTTQPVVTFQWGPPMLGFMYSGLITKVDANYTRFHASGIPVRAELNIGIQTVRTMLDQLPTNPTSGGLPGRSTHLLRDGESLQSVAQQYYGRPGLWRRIAEINGISDPQRVRPGTTVYLPGPAELPGG